MQYSFKEFNWCRIGCATYILLKHKAHYTYRIWNNWVVMVIFEQHFHHIKVAMLSSIVQWCLAKLQMVRGVHTRSYESSGLPMAA